MSEKYECPLCHSIRSDALDMPCYVCRAQALVDLKKQAREKGMSEEQISQMTDALMLELHYSNQIAKRKAEEKCRKETRCFLILAPIILIVISIAAYVRFGGFGLEFYFATGLGIASVVLLILGAAGAVFKKEWACNTQAIGFGGLLMAALLTIPELILGCYGVYLFLKWLFEHIGKMMSFRF